MVGTKEVGEQANQMDRAVFGGYKNFVPRHYVFEGFKDSQEF